MVEVLRLREELIKSVVETNFLVDIYRKQAEITYKTVEVNIRDQIRYIIYIYYIYIYILYIDSLKYPKEMKSILLMRIS